MSRQDKATTERNARVLRDLVKQPDNKACADCRKNDARWASWNLGVFLCIRCSGIHRSMGTHISKVKSIDLDIWTPEQMESVQKWGNKRANAYWEKHLKAGHVPPDHKIESFIRSKYESRRWAMEGPPPSDPSVLDDEGFQGSAPPRPTPTSSAPAPTPAAAPRGQHPLLSRSGLAAPASRQAPAPAATSAPILDLFGADDNDFAPMTSAPSPVPAASRPQAATTAQAAPAPTAAPIAAPTQAQQQQSQRQQPSAPQSNLFDLDFRAPTPTSRPQTAKADIMSLFSNSAPPPSAQASSGGGGGSFFDPTPTVAPPVAQSPYASWGGGITSSAPPQQQHATQSPVSAGTGAGQSGQSQAGWGSLQMDQGGWGAPVQATPAAPPQQSQQHQQHYQQQQQQQQRAPANGGGGDLWGAAPDPWASSGNAGAGNAGFGGVASPQKKNDQDPFANLWS